MARRKGRKQICVNIDEEVFTLMEKKMANRKMDKTNYLSYLIKNDGNDYYNEKVATALNKVTSATEVLAEKCAEDDWCYPFVMELKEGVNTVWQFLQ